MESSQEFLIAGASVMIGFIVVVGLVVAASVALHRRDMRWVQKEAQGLDLHRARIESSYGIRVSRDHIRQTRLSPHSGFVSRAEMGDGSLREILLRETNPVPYVRDSDAWVPLAPLKKAEA